MWAVHISDGVLLPGWLVGGFLIAAFLYWWSGRRLSEEEIPRIAVMSSAFFVASTIHVRIPAASVHLLLNGLVGLMLGRRSAVAITLALVLQALLLGHGGFSTLGVNIVIMTLPALGVHAAFQAYRGPLLSGPPRYLWFVGLLLGFFAVVVTAALNASVLWLGGNEDWPYLALTVLLAHVPIAGIEGFIMAGTMVFLAKVKPEILGKETSFGNKRLVSDS